MYLEDDLQAKQTKDIKIKHGEAQTPILSSLLHTSDAAFLIYPQPPDEKHQN